MAIKLARKDIADNVAYLLNMFKEDMRPGFRKDMENLLIMLNDDTYPNATVVRWVELKADIEMYLRHQGIDIKDIL